MIRNYLKISFRYLQRNKEYTVINILGLAVSITCCILIMLFVRSELSFDTFHSKADRLYRVWQREKYDGKTSDNVNTPLPLADALESTYSQVEAATRVIAMNPIVKIGQTSFVEKMDIVDPAFFKMFDFKLIEGNKEKPLPLDNSVLLTPVLAKKYFGSRDALGKNIEIQLGDDKVLFTVSGIVQEAPEASSIKYHMLIPYNRMTALHQLSPRVLKNWFNVIGETYVMLKPGINSADLEKKFPLMMKQQLGTDFGKEDFTIHLQPVRNIHLNTSLPAGNEPISDPKYSYVLATIGLLILIVACVNFVTLSIGQSTKRALEVGVRKALGAERRQLIFQFWGEAFIVVILSVLVGLGLARLFLEPFDALVSRQLELRFDLFVVLFCVLIAGVIALISGVYPALILSGFNPVDVLKGRFNIKGGQGWLRQGLVVGQFVASIIMIIGTVVIGQQMRYMQTKDLGYKKNQVVVVQTNKPRKAGLPLAQLYRNELMKHSQVLNASVSFFSFAEIPWVQLGYADEKKQYKTFQYNAVDANFVPAMGIKILSGRNFETGNTSDVAGAVLVNETFVKAFNLKDPIGKKMPGRYPQQIVGVVKDFNFESLHTKIQPLVMSVDPDSLIKHSDDVMFNAPPQPRISIQLKPGNLADNIHMLKQSWARVAPGQDFDFQFLDETIAAQYKQEQRTNIIVQIASALSIFIACMGLFGLATLSVVRRIKEIGIRKVLGASVGSIVRLLSVDFLVLVLIAAIVAAPIAWWAMSTWLQDFTYRISINWWVFLLAGLAAALVALATVSYHAIRAALVNPVKSLKTE